MLEDVASLEALELDPTVFLGIMNPLTGPDNGNGIIGIGGAGRGGAGLRSPVAGAALSPAAEHKLTDEIKNNYLCLLSAFKSTHDLSEAARRVKFKRPYMRKCNYGARARF